MADRKTCRTSRLTWPRIWPAEPPSGNSTIGEKQANSYAYRYIEQHATVPEGRWNGIFLNADLAETGRGFRPEVARGTPPPEHAVARCISARSSAKGYAGRPLKSPTACGKRPTPLVVILAEQSESRDRGTRAPAGSFPDESVAHRSWIIAHAISGITRERPADSHLPPRSSPDVFRGSMTTVACVGVHRLPGQAQCCPVQRGSGFGFRLGHTLRRHPRAGGDPVTRCVCLGFRPCCRCQHRGTGSPIKSGMTSELVPGEVCPATVVCRKSHVRQTVSRRHRD